jgi:hypothetical protein
VLACSGFYVRVDGKVVYTDKATTLDTAQAPRAGPIKASLESPVHTEMPKDVRKCCNFAGQPITAGLQSCNRSRMEHILMQQKISSREWHID